jgi:excinuclease ABC subunit C
MASESKKDRFEAIRRQIKGFPTGPGLYFMKGAKDKVLYIGKAKNLRSRVGSYFQPGSDVVISRGPKIVEMINKVETVGFLQTESEVDAILKEARLIKDIHPPYNTDLVDDKTFPYMEITTGEDFPGVYATRKPRPSGSRLFGPFAGAKELRLVLVELQKIFKFRTCTLDIKENDPKRIFFRPCILYSIKQCAAPCAAKIDKPEYKNIVKDLIKFLRSKRSTILRQMRKQMAEAAEKLQYEKAAMFRDRIRLIERLDRRGLPDEDVQPEVFAADPSEALLQLRQILQSPQQFDVAHRLPQGMAKSTELVEGPVRIIEGIDVANIAGNEAVGSLVKFIDGRPFKSGYRRFRIKSVKGIDDYAMIAEVVKRRYKYALRGEELWPDLILIDGGLGHLRAAETALKDMLATLGDGRGTTLRRHLGYGGQADEGRNTKIASIAKKKEEIYLQGSSKPLKLPAHSPARKLLQYVRDEAHRFAQHYFHILQRKKLINKMSRTGTSAKKR